MLGMQDLQRLVLPTLIDLLQTSESSVEGRIPAVLASLLTLSPSLCTSAFDLGATTVLHFCEDPEDEETDTLVMPALQTVMSKSLARMLAPFPFVSFTLP